MRKVERPRRTSIVNQKTDGKSEKEVDGEKFLWYDIKHLRGQGSQGRKALLCWHGSAGKAAGS